MKNDTENRSWHPSSVRSPPSGPSNQTVAGSDLPPQPTDFIPRSHQDSGYGRRAGDVGSNDTSDNTPNGENDGSGNNSGAGVATGTGNDSSSFPLALKLLVSNNVAGSIIGRSGQTISELQTQSSTRIKISQSGDFYPGTQDRVCLVQGQPNNVRSATNLLLTRLYSLQHQQHFSHSQWHRQQSYQVGLQEQSQDQTQGVPVYAQQQRSSPPPASSSSSPSPTSLHQHQPAHQTHDGTVGHSGQSSSSSTTTSGSVSGFSFIVRILVPTPCCGMIIGKGGSNIKEMVESSGVSSVRLSPKENGGAGGAGGGHEYGNGTPPGPGSTAALISATSERVVTITGPDLNSCLGCIDIILEGMTSHPDISRYTNMTTSYARVMNAAAAAAAQNAYGVLVVPPLGSPSGNVAAAVGSEHRNGNRAGPQGRPYDSSRGNGGGRGAGANGRPGPQGMRSGKGQPNNAGNTRNTDQGGGGFNSTVPSQYGRPDPSSSKTRGGLGVTPAAGYPPNYGMATPSLHVPGPSPSLGLNGQTVQHQSQQQQQQQPHPSGGDRLGAQMQSSLRRGGDQGQDQSRSASSTGYMGGPPQQTPPPPHQFPLQAPQPTLQPPGYVAQVAIPDTVIGSILGRAGRTLADLQEQSHTRIRISQRGEYLPGTRNRVVTIRGGTAQSVSTAQFLISQRLVLPPTANSSSYAPVDMRPDYGVMYGDPSLYGMRHLHQQQQQAQQQQQHHHHHHHNMHQQQQQAQQQQQQRLHHHSQQGGQSKSEPKAESGDS